MSRQCSFSIDLIGGRVLALGRLKEDFSSNRSAVLSSVQRVLVLKRPAVSVFSEDGGPLTDNVVLNSAQRVFVVERAADL